MKNNNWLWIILIVIGLFYFINGDKKIADNTQCSSIESSLLTDFRNQLESTSPFPIASSGSGYLHGGYAHFGESSIGWFRLDYTDGNIYVIPTSNYCPIRNNNFISTLPEASKIDAENHLSSLSAYPNNMGINAFSSNQYGESSIHFCSNDNKIHIYITGSNPTHIFNIYTQKMYKCEPTSEPKPTFPMIYLYVGGGILLVVLFFMMKKK